MNIKSYMAGFSKVASDAGYSASQLLQIASMYKQASKAGVLAKLLTKMSPKVDPNKLNWFTRLFTTTKNKLRRVRTRIPTGPGAEGVTLSSGGTYNEGLSDLMTSETRLSPLKILAGLTGVGAGGAAVSSMLPEKKKSLIDKWNDLDPALRKKILIGLGGTGAGALALYGLSSSKNS